MPVLLIKSPVYFLSVWIWTNNWWLRLGASKKSQNCIRHWVSRGWMPPRCAAPLPPLLNVTPMLLPCGCEHRFITHNTLGQTQPNQWKPINIAPGLLRRGRGGSVTLCQCWQCSVHHIPWSIQTVWQSLTLSHSGLLTPVSGLAGLCLTTHIQWREEKLTRKLPVSHIWYLLATLFVLLI